MTEKAEAAVAEKRKFATWQADSANGIADRMRSLRDSGTPPTLHDWEAEYQRLKMERAEKEPLLPTR